MPLYRNDPSEPWTSDPYEDPFDDPDPEVRRRAYRRASFRGLPIAFGLALVAIIVFSIGGLLFSNYQKLEQRVATICDKERDEGEYRIYTDNGTLVMKDIYFNGTRFDTAEAYGRLKEGETYILTTKGWRFGLTSSFPNIVEAELAPEGHGHVSDC
jgi:hypothetical protein